MFPLDKFRHSEFGRHIWWRVTTEADCRLAHKSSNRSALHANLRLVLVAQKRFFCLRTWFWWCSSRVFVVDSRSHFHVSCWPTYIRIRCIKICVENWSIYALKANAFADAIYSFHQIEFEWSKMGTEKAVSECEKRNGKKEWVRVGKKSQSNIK